jgi:serine/threonine protein kinase
MISRKEGQDWVKVVDVGIAKIMDSSNVDADGQKLTGTGMLIGTPAYFSPEQCHGVGMDGRSDLYTLATVLYEMIAGQLPVKGLSAVDYVRAHVVDPPTPLRKHVPTLPPFVEAAVMKALHKKADQRYANAMEMREALRSARERMRTQGPQRRQRIAMIATASAVIVLGLAGVLWLAARQDRNDVDVQVAAPSARGTLDIKVAPENAVIFLDGKPVTPGRHLVAPGKHTVSARAAGYREEGATFEVRARQTVPVSLTLNEIQ